MACNWPVAKTFIVEKRFFPLLLQQHNLFLSRVLALQAWTLEVVT
jgi:hypothetical protein